MSRRAAKVDANQSIIVDALRAAGVSVQSLAEVGDGCPDLLCGINCFNFLIEIKSGNETFNSRQKVWHSGWRGNAHVARTVDEALAIAEHYRRRS